MGRDLSTDIAVRGMFTVLRGYVPAILGKSGRVASFARLADRGYLFETCAIPSAGRCRVDGTLQIIDSDVGVDT